MKFSRYSSAVCALAALVAACGSERGAASSNPFAPPASGGSAGAGEEPSLSEPAAAPVSGEAPSSTVGEVVGTEIELDGSEPLEPPGAEETPVVPEPEVPTGPAQNLREAAERAGRLIGVALRTNRLDSAGYASAAREFNYVTHENEMKWDALERQPGVFSFGNADRTIEFAEANGMQVKGHTLVWHSQLPSWVRELTTRDAVLQAMERHIIEVVGRYRGRVQAWDVVNEAFTDGNSPRLRGSNLEDVNDPNNGNGNNGPDSVFRRLIGEDYIDRAFTLANAADPDAVLFYNDFNAEGTSAKSDAIFNMVQGMLQRGVPIHGVGLQMHINENVDGQRSAEQIAQNIARLTGLGLQVQITELDVSLCGNASIEQRRAEQRQRLADVTRVCMEQPLCSAITLWGVSDPDSWRDGACNEGRSEPLLFDAAFQRKAAYFGVFDELVAAGAQ